ncbi:DUF1501 domain-containing protein [Agaribacter marinus]|uniref:Sulfatase n=1 Tax=Agaribacter marinus TaxID=1431249 RepID=A0AA37SX18_9ALTE|nr:DUF1501 domain-containing protein [Agaribacter marinus]GLR71187.1 sulfatase [Agaribacter marinus]
MQISRRSFLKFSAASAATGIGMTSVLPALANINLNQGKWLGALPQYHATPRAKRVIWLYMAGGPSHVDLFDFKPDLIKYHDTAMPESLTKGQQLAQLQGKELKVRAPSFEYKRYGQSGLNMSSLLPNIGENLADKMCLINSMKTEQINHATAHNFMNTGHGVAGRPCVGSWVDYALGADAHDLPPYVVMVSKELAGSPQPLAASQWHSGFLPSRFQGIEFQSGAVPVHYLQNPGTAREHQQQVVEYIKQMNKISSERLRDPEELTRSLQYEMAFKMQKSLPQLANIDDEPDYIKDMYGIGKGNDSFARNCLLARKMVEGGSRFIQLYHRGWDHHSNIDGQLPNICKTVDQASAALVLDLEQRGLLEDTLVIWGGEFGRTPMSQGSGRDHHINCFSMWMAGGGIKPGMVYGKSDDLGYSVVDKQMHVHDLHATLLYLLGIDHARLTYRSQGRDFRLTDVHGHVATKILA